jgi:hypothetical protein
MRGVTRVRKRQIGGQRHTTKTDKSSGRQSGRLISAGPRCQRTKSRGEGTCRGSVERHRCSDLGIHGTGLHRIIDMRNRVQNEMTSEAQGNAVAGCDGTKLAMAAPTTAWVVSIIREIPSWRSSNQTANTDRALHLSWTFCPEIGHDQRPSIAERLLRRCSVCGHQSEIVFCVLVVVFSPDDIPGSRFLLG